MINNTWLLFLVPPAAGAIIGYVTNVIAIRMLFRPLNEVRVFGIRLPFTPGILPKQRKKLAVSIGAMVERELLTPEILRERLNREDVRQKIKESISFFTDNILDKKPKELSAGSEKILSEKFPYVIEKVYPVFSSAVLKFLHRDDIRRELEGRGRIILRNIILKLNTFQRFFVSAGQYDQTLEEKMPEIIEELTESIKRLLQEDNVKKYLTGAASSSFDRLLGENNKSIGETLSISEEEKIKLDSFLLDKLTKSVDTYIEGILSSIDVKVLVSDRIDSLDMKRVERIILDVMSNQLKWVELFGGVLGFMLGIFQAGLTYFLR